MVPPTTDWEDLHRRLNRIEKQNRILKGLATCAVAVVGVVLLTGQATPEKSIEANRFVLRDQDGSVRAALEMVEGAPMLRLFDSAGRPRIVESVTSIGSSVGILDVTGKPRAAMMATLTGDPSLTLFDEEGKPKEVLGVLNGAPEMALFDSARRTRVGLEVASNGTPKVSVADANGKRRVILSVTSTGDPLVGLLDENEQPRAALGRNANGDGLILFGPNVKPAITMAMYPSGTATGNVLTFWDQNSKPRLSMGTFSSAGAPGIVASDGESKVIWKAP